MARIMSCRWVCLGQPRFSACLSSGAICRAGGSGICGKLDESKDIFDSHPFVRLVEVPSPTALRSISAFKLVGDALVEQSSIQGLVHPDLPPEASWWQLLHILGFRQQKQVAADSREDQGNGGVSAFEAKSSGGKLWQVRTVAAHTATMPELCKRMMETAAGIEANGGGGSLLLLTGAHAFRKWPLVNKLLPGNSFAMLEAARKLRQTGDLPPGIQLWSVENPLTNSVGRLEKKIAAGAEAVILQPPLLADKFADWWTAADRQGLLKGAHIIVGLPLISSAKNLAFWLHLTESNTGKEADSVVAEFQRAEWSLNPADLDTFFLNWNLKLIQLIKSLPDAAGMHVMPVTPRGWRQFSALLSQGKL